MKRRTKTGNKKSRHDRLKERENKAAMRKKMAGLNAGSNHQNPNHVRDSTAPWRAAREAGLNPKKQPLARRKRRSYGNPNGVFWKSRFRWDGAPIRREHGSFQTQLPQAASHLLKARTPTISLFPGL